MINSACIFCKHNDTNLFFSFPMKNNKIRYLDVADVGCMYNL